MSDEMPRISDERLHDLREIVACSVKGRGVYLEPEWADDLASVLRELEERRGKGERAMNTKTYYCPETDRAFEIDVDGVEWSDDTARIDCPAHEQPGRHSITIAKPASASFGGGDA